LHLLYPLSGIFCSTNSICWLLHIIQVSWHVTSSESFSPPPI
jgi:hypothetical protein